MTLDSSYYLNKIEINHDLENKTGLIIHNLFCDIIADKIVILGNLLSDNQNMAVVIGAYAISSGVVSEISANAFNTTESNTSFNLKFNNKEFDKIFLYANYVNHEDNANYINNNTHNELVSSIKDIQAPNNNKTNSSNEINNNFSIVDRLLNSYTVEDDVYNVYGIKVVSVGINDEDIDIDELVVNVELIIEKVVKPDLCLYIVFYDRNNNILANDYIVIDNSYQAKRRIESVYLSNIKFAKAERFNIFVSDY